MSSSDLLSWVRANPVKSCSACARSATWEFGVHIWRPQLVLAAYFFWNTGNITRKTIRNCTFKAVINGNAVATNPSDSKDRAFESHRAYQISIIRTYSSWKRRSDYVFLGEKCKRKPVSCRCRFFVITVGMVLLGFITANMHSMGKPASRKVRKKGFCENKS